MLLRFFFTLSVEVVFGKLWVLSCNSNEDCSEGYFCDKKFCRKCLNCDLLFRKGNSCVIDFNVCEGCLDGYREVLTTEFSSSVKPCKLIKKTNKLKMCTNDYSCPPSNYCDGDFCVKCFDCSLVNRLPPIEKCAKEVNECGACMTGFNKVAVTAETNVKPCEKNFFAIPEKIDYYKKSSSDIAPVCFLTAVLVAAILFLTIKHRKDRNTTKNIHEHPIRPSAPPLYVIDMPQCVETQDEVLDLPQCVETQDEVLDLPQCVETQDEVIDLPQCIKKQEESKSFPVTYVKEKMQLAKVFKQPDALYYFYTEKELYEMSNESSANNETRPDLWASATRAVPEEMGSAAILIHTYSDMSDSSRSLSIHQSNGNRPSSIALDIMDGAQTIGNSVQEANDNLCDMQRRDQKKA